MAKETVGFNELVQAFHNALTDAMAPLPMRSAYVADHPREVFECTGPGLCRQEFAEECDINTIMKKYEHVGGMFPNDENSEPQYFDTVGIPDYQEALNLVIAADEAFMTLPAKVRARFGNDAGAFCAYALDPNNIEQLREWELAPPAPVPPAPQRVEIVPPPVPPVAANAA